MRRIQIVPMMVFLGGSLSAGVAQGQTPAAEDVNGTQHLRPQTPFIAPGNLSTVTFDEIDSPPDGKTRNPKATDGADQSQGQAQGTQQGSTIQNPVTCGLTHVGQCLKELVRAPKDVRYAELVQRNREHEATTLLLHAAQHLVQMANRLPATASSTRTLTKIRT